MHYTYVFSIFLMSNGLFCPLILNSVRRMRLWFMNHNFLHQPLILDISLIAVKTICSSIENTEKDGTDNIRNQLN